MLIGSGLLATAFAATFSHREDVCVYAAGVSNSSCLDRSEFEREKARLHEALKNWDADRLFVYFGTCSVADPDAKHTPYVQHKLAMERLVSAHPNHLVVRLPQVAGRTPNPHTLLNFLHARISRSEAFQLWMLARRNIIDVDDVVALSSQLVESNGSHNVVINVANTTNYSMLEIVQAMERSVGKSAIYQSLERGSGYEIDTSTILPILQSAGVAFGPGYLQRVADTYYGKAY
ncbi:MAG: NAD-dependent epimerase/dehydratase family protein [Gallionella sp.]